MPDMHWNDKKLKLAALHQAARRGNLTKVEQLLKGKGKAQADEAGEFNDTPMMWAAYEGHPEVVNRLLALGANVKAVDKINMTPLHLAAANGHCEIITKLLSKGANAKAIDVDGWTAMDWAASGDHPDAIRTFVAGKVSADVHGADGKTALHHAAVFGHPAAIRALIKGGADVNRSDKYKVAPLHMAVEENRFVSVETLLENGANPNVKDRSGMTPLHYAARTPLHYYAPNIGHVDIIEQLIGAGADLEQTDKNGRTPLYYSQRRGHHNVTKLLIDMGDFAAKAPKDESVAERVYTQAATSIVFIQTDTARPGSGVIVEGDLVVTNHHIASKRPRETQPKLVVYKAKGRRIIERERYDARVIDGDRDRDFCLLHVPGLKGEAMSIRPYHDLRVGEDVYAIGNPLGETLTITAGVISQMRDEGERREIQTNAAISDGSSGGGLFDKYGNLIGITTESLVQGQNINYAIAADLLWGFIPFKRR